MATVPNHWLDPTGTATLRENYRKHLQRPLNQLITDIREFVINEDGFGLQVTPETLVADGGVVADTAQTPSPTPLPTVEVYASDDLPPLMRLDRDERKEELFHDWLTRRLADGPLEQIQRGENTYIRSAYSNGVKRADRRLREQGIDVGETSLETVFNLGVHTNAVEDLFAANYADLEDITAELSKQIGDELAQGFVAGENPRSIATRLTDRVDKIGRTRAETLARTRVIETYSDATLNRYEQFGITRVEVKAEWRTAEDERVCPICESLNGEVWTTETVRNGSFEFEPGEGHADHLAGQYPIKPPTHPRCRCALLPSLT